jgi:regulator of cell morphogenesis and NO signaling
MGHRHKDKNSDRVWNDCPLKELIDHIVSTHHAYLRAELPALEKLAGAVGTNLPEAELVRLVKRLNQDLELQMQKEETILFPAILALEPASRERRHIEHSKFGSVRNLAKVLGSSRSQTLKAIEEIRHLTNDYNPPMDANGVPCLFRRLASLDRDLHRHIYLENEILFRRAAELEEGIQ